MERPISAGDYVRVKSPKVQRSGGHYIRQSHHEFTPGLVRRVFKLGGILTAEVSWTYRSVVANKRSGVDCCFPVDELERDATTPHEGSPS